LARVGIEVGEPAGTRADIIINTAASITTGIA